VQTILVATDLSERSDRALRRAADLARRFGAALHVVHVVDDALPDSVAEAQRANVEALLGRQLRTAPFEGIEISAHVPFGDPWRTILEQAESLRADLAVLGIHRARGFLDRFRGTTIERVAAASPVPVLAVTAPVTGPYSQPLVGVDFSECAARAARLAAVMAPGKALTLVNAYHIPYRALALRSTGGGEMSKRDRLGIEAGIRAQAGAFDTDLGPDLTCEWVLVEGTPAEAMATEARRRGADLICVGTHGRSWLSRAFLGSTAERMLADPPCDVLVVPLRPR
jgi:nucleotide-binding universal stress UspA family protein